MAEVPVITVDGPSGTGKGTVSSYLADWLGWHILDSGALYRVLAHAALNNKIPLDSEAELANLAADLNVVFKKANDDLEIRVFLNEEDVSETIRTETYGSVASQIAALSGVRHALLDRQKAFQCPPGLIADGRDMGTVVFPDAPLKIFLTASPGERAKRRHKQLKQKGIGVNLQHLSADITERDARDQARTISPLKPAKDAIVIDSTELDVDDINKQVSELVRQKFSGYSVITTK